MRKQIEEMLGIKAIDIYGLSEILGPGVASECECQYGLHVNEDLSELRAWAGDEAADPDGKARLVAAAIRRKTVTNSLSSMAKYMDYLGIDSVRLRPDHARRVFDLRCDELRHDVSSVLS